jgi:hypothetical protein
MTIDPITVRGRLGREAERLLRLHRISGLPVVGTEGRLVGVISQSDLLWHGDLPLNVLLGKKTSTMKVAELMVDAGPGRPDDGDPHRGRGSCATTRPPAGRRQRRRLAIGVLSAIDFVTLFADVA